MKTQKFEIVDAWAVHGDSGTDRHNDGPLIGYCNNQKDAEAYAQGKGWWGGCGKIEKVPALVINGDTYILASPEPVKFVEGASERLAAEQKQHDEALRQRTLASMTAEQRRVLGY